MQIILWWFMVIRATDSATTCKVPLQYYYKLSWASFNGSFESSHEGNQTRQKSDISSESWIIEAVNRVSWLSVKLHGNKPTTDLTKICSGSSQICRYLYGVNVFTEKWNLLKPSNLQSLYAYYENIPRQHPVHSCWESFSDSTWVIYSCFYKYSDCLRETVPGGLDPGWFPCLFPSACWDKSQPPPLTLNKVLNVTFAVLQLAAQDCGALLCELMLHSRSVLRGFKGFSVIHVLAH